MGCVCVTHAVHPFFKRIGLWRVLSSPPTPSLPNPRLRRDGEESGVADGGEGADPAPRASEALRLATCPPQPRGVKAEQAGSCFSPWVLRRRASLLAQAPFERGGAGWGAETATGAERGARPGTSLSQRTTTSSARYRRRGEPQSWRGCERGRARLQGATLRARAAPGGSGGSLCLPAL